MFCKNLIRFSLILWVVGLTPGFAHETAYLVCYSKDASNTLHWNWALDENQHYSKVTGYSIEDDNGKIVFLSELDPIDLTIKCNNTISYQQKGFKLVKMRVSFRALGKDYPLRFPNPTAIEASKRLAQKLSQSLTPLFLGWAKEVLEARKSNYVLAQALYKQIHNVPKDRMKLLPFIEDGVRYEAVTGTPIQWKSEDPMDRVMEYLDRFKDISDSHLFMASIKAGPNGLKRGAFNSYLDLVTASFQPDHEKVGLGTPSIFRKNSPDHRKLLAFSKAFSNLSTLQGISETILSLGESPDSELATQLLSYLLETLAHTTKSLTRLKSHIHGQDLHKLRAIEELFKSSMKFTYLY